MSANAEIIAELRRVLNERDEAREQLDLTKRELGRWVDRETKAVRERDSYQRQLDAIGDALVTSIVKRIEPRISRHPVTVVMAAGSLIAKIGEAIGCEFEDGDDLLEAVKELARERDEWRDKFHASNQTAGELCDACGWAFKLPGEPCRCEVVRERDEARAKLNAEYLRHADAFRLAMEQIEHWKRRAGSAFERGAKAMREACAARIGSDPALFVSLRSHCESALRALPIPEEP